MGEYLIVADSGNHRIRKIAPNGYTTTIAGNGEAGYLNAEAANAEFVFPTGIAILGDRLFVADSGNNVIRVIDFD
jgi:DNA-binding beta-propeller fold protein YncE